VTAHDARKMTIRVEHGDMRKVIPRLVAEGIVADAIVTDPPYHLTSGNLAVDWSAFGPSNNPKAGRFDPTTGLYQRRCPTNKSGRGHRTGFMGKTWDGGDVALSPETWATIARH